MFTHGLTIESNTDDPLNMSAWSALQKSCYTLIDWKIPHTAPVSDAIARMATHNIGALAVTKGDTGEIVGIVSERDYLNKVGVVGRTSKDTLVGEICTYGRSNLVSVSMGNPIHRCMTKMIHSNLRHLFVRESETGLFVGIISIKDVIKCDLDRHEAVVEKLKSLLQKSA